MSGVPGRPGNLESRGAPRVRFWLLALKELRETLRDRRTIITLVLMPLIVYPILSLVFRTFLLSSVKPGSTDNLVRYRIGILSNWDEKEISNFVATLDMLASAEQEARPAEPSAPSQLVSGGDEAGAPQPVPGAAEEAPLAQHEFGFDKPGGGTDPATLLEGNQQDLVVELGGDPQSLRGGQPITVRLVYYGNVAFGRRAAAFFREHLDRFNRHDLQQRLQVARADSKLSIRTVEERLAAAGGPAGVSLTSIIPLILVLMTVTGAVYPAIDLTAGERERGTLETLIATPVPRLRILLGKLVAVLTVAVLTATLNVTGMLATVWAFQLDRIFMPGNPLTAGIFVRIFALLVLFATFFSALLLVVTSFARSFKEAQAYLIPVIMLSFAPGLIALSPGLSLSGPLAVVPMVNILLLARDILEGNAELVPAAVAVFSTLVYASAAIGLAATIFGADSILYGSQGSWQDLLLRPVEPVATAAPATAMLVLALLLPLNFVAIALMQKLGSNINQFLLMLILFTAISFLLVPSFIAWRQRVRWFSGFGLRAPGWLPLACAILLGLSMWPMLSNLISLPYNFYDWITGAETSESSRQKLLEHSRAQVEALGKVPLPLFIAALAVVPAICEEWFFRGLFLRSLLAVGRPVWAILASAVAFGAFHTLSGSVMAFDRLLPTIVMGAVLGWIAWRTGSIWPGMLLHMLHNATISLLARTVSTGSAPGWLPNPDEPFPAVWTIASLAMSILLIATIALTTRVGREVAPASRYSV